MNIEPELEIINRAVEAHGIQEIWALFSGGHDSLVSTHVASHHSLFNGVLHIDTGIGIKETRKFVIGTCKRYRWALQIYSAKLAAKADRTPMAYRDLVLKYGFPGGAQHSMMYTWLKERQIDRFVRDRKAGDKKFRIGLISGVRTHESRKRTLNMDKLVDGCMRDGSRVWIAPIGDWTDDKCEELIRSANLPRNPVKDNLCMSGECCCGAFAQPNELAQIEFFYPEFGAYLRKLEAEVKAAGFPWGWEEQPPRWWVKKKQHKRLEENGQLNLFSFFPLAEACREIEGDEDVFLPLCSSCQQLRR